MKFFKHDHLKDEKLKAISEACCKLAQEMEEKLPDSAEKSAGLRKLLEAKDCFVRCLVD